MLISDEISLAVCILYFQSQKKIIRIEDLKEMFIVQNLQIRRSYLRIIRGVKCKFKQPILYYFAVSIIKTSDHVIAL